MANTPALVLASSSPWRRNLLDRLGLPYTAESPDVDETPQPGEPPAALVARLAHAKAAAVATRHPHAVVIGSDQVADLDGEHLGKPGTAERARQQLRRQSGRTVVFRTGVCVCAPAREAQIAVVDVTTRFRELGDDEITRYVAAEDVTATAGSIKSEGLGIALVNAIHSDDPSALVGLPLITVREMLAHTGIALP